MCDPEPAHLRAMNDPRDDVFGIPHFRFTAKRDLALKISFGCVATSAPILQDDLKVLKI